MYAAARRVAALHRMKRVSAVDRATHRTNGPRTQDRSRCRAPPRARAAVRGDDAHSAASMQVRFAPPEASAARAGGSGPRELVRNAPALGSLLVRSGRQATSSRGRVPRDHSLRPADVHDHSGSSNGRRETSPALAPRRTSARPRGRCAWSGGSADLAEPSESRDKGSDWRTSRGKGVGRPDSAPPFVRRRDGGRPRSRDEAEAPTDRFSSDALSCRIRRCLFLSRVGTVRPHRLRPSGSRSAPAAALDCTRTQPKPASRGQPDAQGSAAYGSSTNPVPNAAMPASRASVPAIA